MAASVFLEGKILTVTEPIYGSVIFQTLDDCFGMDRIRAWAHEQKIELHPGYRKAWDLGKIL